MQLGVHSVPDQGLRPRAFPHWSRYSEWLTAHWSSLKRCLRVPRPDRRTTENRDPHTVYLTPDTWEALEQEYLQRRMAGGPGVSKIEFIENLIRSALPGRKVRTPAVRQPVVSEPSISSEPSAETQPTIAPPAPSRKSPPKRVGAQPRRRNSALERLLEASDPGRPAPIVSAAGAGTGSGGGGEVR